MRGDERPVARPGRLGDPVSCERSFTRCVSVRSSPPCFSREPLRCVSPRTRPPRAPVCSTAPAAARSADAVRRRHAGPAGRHARRREGARVRRSSASRRRASRRSATSYAEPFTFARRARRPTPAERHGVNVVGHIDGTRSPTRYIVVSAHYDHIGMRNGVVFNGADDNASGTAALFAVAKYFSDAPRRRTRCCSSRSTARKPGCAGRRRS